MAAGLFRRGVLVAGTLLNAKTLRIEPALNIPRPLVDEVLEKLEDTLREVAGRRWPTAPARPRPRPRPAPPLE